jgi:hypothetical protein
MANERTETWDLWYPEAAATGLPFARSRIDGAEVLLVHAAPPVLSVWVRDAGGQVVAGGEDLAATDDTPITRLTRRDGRIEREDIWPGSEDIGRLVILPGGEAGTMVKWHNADDHSEWRWQIELYNRK